jgi:hypothetical protein
MSYAKYSTTDRWRWVGGCVHEHVSVVSLFKPYGINGPSVGLEREDSNGQVLQVEYHHLFLAIRVRDICAGIEK